MDIRKVTETFAVSPQIEVSDIPAIAEAGFTAIICNRPDEEEAGQPAFEEIAAAAKQAGLATFSVPIASGMFGPQHVTQMQNLIDEADGPILAYCRSGTRSIMLWAFQEVTKRPRDEVLRDAALAGYDLSQQL
ncbi:MAG: TIGR01244 family phosphatase [Devosiaceae bacterium]|nr:TIGR01244 family phosphatase [Devosiaceae bacterium MH13]